MENEIWMKRAIEAITDGRTRTVGIISKEKNKSLNFGCYVCDKRKETLYEVIMEGGEPFWFGTSCVKKFKELTGIDLKKEAIS